MITTNESLLDRLRADNAQEAWREFFAAYWGVILRYGRKMGLRQDQAEDVLQETMVVLMRKLPEFVYDRRKGRFRNFLLTIVHRRALAVFGREARNPAVAWEELSPELVNQVSKDHRVGESEAQARWREALLEEALRRLRCDGRLGAGTLAVFEAYVVRAEPAIQVARRFKMTENSVYQIRNRVLRRVKAEVRRLQQSAGDPLEP
jgi:RNA polymerase sigma-70 factor (ECF subfamily)